MEKMECPICKKKALFVGVHDDEGNYHGLVGCEYGNDPWSGLSYALNHEGWGDCPMCTDGAYSTMGGMLFDTAEEAINALTPPNEWVSVEERLPPEHEPVLCIVDGKPKPNITLEDAYQIGSWNKADGWIIDEYLDWEDADVSWWMSLPAPPGKDNNVPTNEPLTIEELREMDGEPVWVDDEKTYAILQVWDDDNIDAIFSKPRGCIHAKYAIGMKIYRRPPEGEEDT